MATKPVRHKVIAFRLTNEQFDALNKKFLETPPAGVNSPGLMCRKMALDFTHDEIAWKSKKKRGLAPEAYTEALAPVASVPVAA